MAKKKNDEVGLQTLVNRSKTDQLSPGGQFMVALKGYKILRKSNMTEVPKYVAYSTGLSAQALIEGLFEFIAVKK